MATLAAAVYHRLFDRAEQSSRGHSRAGGRSVRLRAFANDDIYFYMKRIDNSGVVREHDPKASGACWKLIGTVGAAVVLLIGVLLPRAYGLLAGYQIESLRQEGQRLSNEQASLELQEARLLSPARMEELARIQQFIDPAPQKVVYLDAPKGRSLASAAPGRPQIHARSLPLPAGPAAVVPASLFEAIDRRK